MADDVNTLAVAAVLQYFVILVANVTSNYKNKKAVHSQGNRAMPQLFFSV